MRNYNEYNNYNKGRRPKTAPLKAVSKPLFLFCIYIYNNVFFFIIAFIWQNHLIFHIIQCSN